MWWIVQEARKALTFTLTASQERVLGEVLDDLARSRPMFRLLQGDVGSGKTVVAFLALMAAVSSGDRHVAMGVPCYSLQVSYRTCTLHSDRSQDSAGVSARPPG